MTTFGTNYGNLELQYALAVQDAISYYLVDGTMPNYGTLYGNSEKRLAIAIVENTTIGGGGGSATWGGIAGTLSDQTDLSSALSGKQSTLVSGTNIKTINNQSILGNGNINVSGGSPQVDYTELWLKFNGANNSTDFVDESKNSYLIIPTGTPVISTNESKFGGSSLYLNSNSYLSLPSINFKTNWTIETWVKTSSAGYRCITCQDAGSSNEWTLLIDPDGTLSYYNYSYPANPVFDDNLNVIDNTWHHLAIIRNKTSLYFYINGSLRSQVNNLTNFDYSTITPIRIGFMPSYGRFFNGYIDNFRISLKAIYTPTLYPNGFTLPDEDFNVTAL